MRHYKHWVKFSGEIRIEGFCLIPGTEIVVMGSMVETDEAVRREVEIWLRRAWGDGKEHVFCLAAMMAAEEDWPFPCPILPQATNHGAIAKRDLYYSCYLLGIVADVAFGKLALDGSRYKGGVSVFCETKSGEIVANALEKSEDLTDSFAHVAYFI